MNAVRLGLKENWKQFVLLIIVNAFVGGMIGMERNILPQIAETKFHLIAKTAILSFIIVFGISKAVTNYYTGAFANKIGRKNLLVIGWIVALPIPYLLIYASSWNWVLVANLLLGISQGITWSSTVVMKIDLVGAKDRGLAMGLNEFAGYLSVALVALFTGWIASTYGISPYPFYIGIALSSLGLIISLICIKDTKHHVAIESEVNSIRTLKNVFWDTTWKERTLGSVTQAGLVNNLNDGMTWGLLPIILMQQSFSIEEIGMLTATYPAVWGIGQLFTGKMSDHISKKKMLFWGMFIQGAALLCMVFAIKFWEYFFVAVALGWGTAMVYPTFLSTIAAYTNTIDRPKSLGVFRLWRDLGYAFGALITGIIADTFGLSVSIISIGLITILSAIIIKVRMVND